MFNWGVNGFSNADEATGAYDYGDKQVNFFDFGFDALINMGFVDHVSQSTEALFSSYSDALNKGALANVGVLSYIGSHDDMNSYDQERQFTFDTAFKLMLAPGGVQIYYGDELARPMQVEGTVGDAGLRLPKDWNSLNDAQTQVLLNHWQKLGRFRKRFPAIGAGVHTQLSEAPYVFKRTLEGSASIIASQNLSSGSKEIKVSGVYQDGQWVKDYYSGQSIQVKDQAIRWQSPYTYALIGPDSK